MALSFFGDWVGSCLKYQPRNVQIYKFLVNSGLHKDLFTRSLRVGVLSCCEADSEVEAKKHVPSVEHTTVIPVETSMKYLKSEAYKETYGNKPVWSQYRRNHKGAIPPLKTRKTCIRGGKISTGNPCPICRDEYLVLHHENVDLLNQFISPHTGEILSYSKTGLCQKRHMELLVAIEKAKDYGFITFDVPFRKYDYSLYYKS
ncbi:28S ribosomal protein S18b, mitochondrial [Cryptotermes secundus]|uniref:28S ribosomal protein S18b, mitochondrial n=1 Tax=Cryptotermes secundus TaxID=105785 RepID=UPI000CD7BA5D|nr:28S ribosomal protein S18b, mitochondrial [Cryptotermes secundus]